MAKRQWHSEKKDFQFHIKLSLEGRLTTVKLLKSWCFEGLRVLRISVTEMIEAFFGDLKFSIPGYFWEGKFGTYFLGWLILVGIFLGIQNNLKIRGSARVNQTCFALISLTH